MLLAAALLSVFIGLAHSVLGEKYILRRLFRRPLPKLLGGEEFTRKTIRFAWHVTTLAWFGFAAQMLLIHFGLDGTRNLLLASSATFAATGAVALLASRGLHLSWIVFFAIAVLGYLAAGSH